MVIKLSQIGSKIAEPITLDRPLEHLMACHRRIEDRLETLVRAGSHLETRAGEALEAVRGAFRFLDSNGVLHTEDEEQSVFPRLRGHLAEEEARYLERLEAEHDEADRTYAKLKQIASELGRGVTPELAERYRETAATMQALYARHIASEDETLIALGRRALSEGELAAIAAEMKRRRGL